MPPHVCPRTPALQRPVTAAVALGLACVSLVGCVATPDAPTSRTGTLVRADGSAAGTVTSRDTGSGVAIRINLSGMTPGQYGSHIHAVGRCDAPDFASAGAHLNPTGAQHGAHNPAGPHAGDLGNITVGSDGKAVLDKAIPSLAWATLHDADGAAVIVHAAADDERTDPTGNSGARVLCAVL